mgnify:CR=1 FL=1
MMLSIILLLKLISHLLSKLNHRLGVHNVVLTVVSIYVVDCDRKICMFETDEEVENFFINLREERIGEFLYCSEHWQMQTKNYSHVAVNIILLFWRSKFPPRRSLSSSAREGK